MVNLGNSYGARPVHIIITMIKWIRTSRLSIKNSLSRERRGRASRTCTPGIRPAPTWSLLAPALHSVSRVTRVEGHTPPLGKSHALRYEASVGS